MQREESLKEASSDEKDERIILQVELNILLAKTYEFKGANDKRHNVKNYCNDDIIGDYPNIFSGYVDVLHAGLGDIPDKVYQYHVLNQQDNEFHHSCSFVQPVLKILYLIR